MIPSILSSRLLGYITQQHGKKFLNLEQDIDETKLAELRPQNGEQASLYIHIPFCRTLCPYCCFNRYLFRENTARLYYQALRRELALYINRGFRFSTFYFGGGTPTILMDELLEFIALLKKNFDVKQISVETTPREINKTNIALLQQAGINRLSIGIQSFDDKLLKAMSRAWCTGQEIQEKILLAEDKFDTVNIDFLFNFPSQSVQQLETDLEILDRLHIDQATFYPLMPSPHKVNALERNFNRVDMSQEKSFYDIILKHIGTNSYMPSTAWCFSQGNRMIDEYIVDFDNYIGIGSGSVSLLRNNFYVNTFSLQKYSESLQRGQFPIIRWRKLSNHDMLYYYLLSKLFGLSLDSRRFHEKFHVNIHSKLRMEILSLKLSGLIKEKDGTIWVTPKGMYPVSVMMRNFFSSLNGLREYCIENQI